MNVPMITAAQVKRIHAMKGEICLSDDNYRALLSGWGVTTSKDLAELQARQVIAELAKLTRRPTPKKFDEYTKRDHTMATPKQLRMIDAMWTDVTTQITEEKRTLALRFWLNDRFKIFDITAIKRRDVEKVVKALEEMKRQKQERLQNGNANP